MFNRQSKRSNGLRLQQELEHKQKLQVREVDRSKSLKVASVFCGRGNESICGRGRHLICGRM